MAIVPTVPVRVVMRMMPMSVRMMAVGMIRVQQVRWGRHHHIRIPVRRKIVRLLDHSDRKLRCLVAGLVRIRVMRQVGMIKYTMCVWSMVVGSTVQ